MQYCLITFLARKGNKEMAKYATCLKVLMMLVVEIDRARSSKDPVRLEEAEKKLEDYEKLVRKLDEVLIDMTRGKFLPKEKV
jgi:hypothetical protein